MAELLRAYRFALDPTAAQLENLAQHAGAARWAFNHALAAKLDAHSRWQMQVDELVTIGFSGKAARRAATVKVPSKGAVQKAWNRIKGDETRGVAGVCPWWRSVSTYAFQSAWDDVDRAWKNWLESLSGKRVGRRVGAPRFKKKGRSKDSFRLHHDVKQPTIRPDGYRRLVMPRLGSIRLHDSAKRLCRVLDRGGVVQSVTVSRGGHRWYASVLVKEPFEEPEPTRRQTAAGTVGVDLGTHHLAALSDDTVIDNPRHLRKARRRLLKAQRALSRTEKGSNRRRKAAARLGRIHHQVAEQRAAHLHQNTKRVAADWHTVAVEDLNVAGMTASARGSIDNPGRNVRAKAGLNRSILDASPAEFRRQLTYKTSWYGSRLALCDRWFPSSKMCSACGAVKAKLSLFERRFTCDGCGFVLDRDINAARNIAAAAVVAPDAEETQNARGADVRPPSSGAVAVGMEAGRPGGASAGSSRRSDPPVVLTKTA